MLASPLSVAVRGNVADVIILEEAAFMPPATFFQVVVPLIGVKNTTLIAISTPENDKNYYSRLMELKDQYGQYLFFNIQLGTVCDECLKMGRACNHLLMMRPSWQTAESKAKMDAIYAADTTMRDTETGGVVASTGTPVITALEIARFKERPVHQFLVQPDVLYCGIDPAGGGNSYYIAGTVALSCGCPVIVGADMTKTKNSDVLLEMLNGHFDRLTKHFPNAWIRVFFEVNLSNIDADMHCKSLMQRYPRVICEKSEIGGLLQFGFRTDEALKEVVANEMQRSISHLCYAPQFQTISRYADDAKAALLDQLAEFRCELIPARGNKPARRSYNGKGGGKHDDLFLALGFAITFAYKLQHNPKFQAFCSDRRIVGC